jgi:2-polyprenyl-3-methyl-5-hydroxy-6-metoxy-1,4-benzoquinol methylase
MRICSGRFDALLKSRVLEPEEMDDPSIPQRDHELALKGLARLNRISGAAASIWDGLYSAGLARNAGIGPLRFLDIATGGGDVPIALVQKARRRGHNLDAAGADRSPTALAYADERANRSNVDIEWLILDALEDPIPTGYDFISCSLFLHHLSDDAVGRLLARMSEAARRGIIVNDLERSSINLGLVWLGAHLLSRSPVVHRDSVRSVRAAFTLEEIGRLAWRAGLAGATIRRCFPCRYRLTWIKN